MAYVLQVQNLKKKSNFSSMLKLLCCRRTLLLGGNNLCGAGWSFSRRWLLTSSAAAALRKSPLVCSALARLVCFLSYLWKGGCFWGGSSSRPSPFYPVMELRGVLSACTITSRAWCVCAQFLWAVDVCVAQCETQWGSTQGLLCIFLRNNKGFHAPAVSWPVVSQYRIVFFSLYIKERKWYISTVLIEY